MKAVKWWEKSQDHKAKAEEENNVWLCIVD